MVRAANETSKTFYAGCLAWCLGCVLLVQKDLGVIAFVGSILASIWVFGLREKFESEETSSAYSVFNKGGRAIAGGLTGEQLDQQLRGGFSNSNNNKKDEPTVGDKPLTTTTTGGAAGGKVELSPQDKLKRRTAAAAAAERRLQQMQQQQQ